METLLHQMSVLYKCKKIQRYLHARYNFTSKFDTNWWVDIPHTITVARSGFLYQSLYSIHWDVFSDHTSGTFTEELVIISHQHHHIAL